jgi:hypothetical protein
VANTLNIARPKTTINIIKAQLQSIPVFGVNDANVGNNDEIKTSRMIMPTIEENISSIVELIKSVCKFD